LLVAEPPVFLSNDTVWARFKFDKGEVFFQGERRFSLYYTLAQGE
jgi:hypothetical protein